ncbi:unnamed protein product [Heterobilharzia americana]|nr:unnamed protein product [Heterobilharzia americana]
MNYELCLDSNRKLCNMKSSSSLVESNEISLGSNPEFIVNKEWKLIKRIGAGSFGEIFLALNKRTGEQAAVKLEAYRPDASIQLQTECQLFESVK